MTGTIDDTFMVTDPGGRGPGRRLALDEAAALIEQAKGVLIFRYSIGPEAALSLMELWAAEADVAVGDIAGAVVRDICQGQELADPRLVRWLEERLRHEATAMRLAAEPEPAHVQGPGTEAVVAAVDHSDVSLDAVVEAVRSAARLGVPLELTVSPHVLPETSEATRAQLMQRMDLAVELARSLEPGVEVRLPRDNPLSGG